MAISPKLQMRQVQTLAMTPQLLQSIRLLQLGQQELAEFLSREAEKNPLLIVETPQLGQTGDSPSPFQQAGAAEPSASPQPQSSGLPPARTGNSERAAGSSGNRGDGDLALLEARLADTLNLSDHLRGQAAAGFAGSASDRLPKPSSIRSTMTVTCADRWPIWLARSEPATSEIEAILLRIQQFDPPGIAARNLAECLALQLRERDRFDPAMQALIENLELAARRDFQALRKICQVDRDDLADMIAELRALDPKPGHRFVTGIAPTVIPDVLVMPAPDGGWHVELNSAALPRLLVDRQYHAHIAKGVSGPTEKAFVADCLQNANWLVRSLQQRATTMLKVATEIVKRQDAFLVDGVEHLKPLTLKTVADAIKMHESTVSRVTANKYMATHRGLFEMKYFFATAIAATEGEAAHAGAAVRHRIRQLIESEAGDRVLSDDAIVLQLRRNGIEIARRTVAKYREAMNIPSSAQRRREKRMHRPLHAAPTGLPTHA